MAADERLGVWLVTAGQYSDFGVVAAFSTEAAANQAMHNGLGDNVQFCPLDVELDQPPEGMTYWAVQMDEDGERVSAYHQPDNQYDGNFVLRKAFSRFGEWHGPEAYGFGGKVNVKPGRRFYCECWARDREHAIKICNEQRAMAIASNA